MNQAEQTQLVNEYIANKTQLYQDWYAELQQLDGDRDTEFFAPPPSEKSIIERFKAWFEQHKAVLRAEICVKWQYSAKRERFQTINALIVSLAVDALTMAFPIPTASLATLAILVLDGYLDDLCSENNP